MTDSDEFRLPREPGHSGFGIASFVIALVSGAMELVLVVTAGIIESSRPGALEHESALAMLLGCGVIFGLLAVLTGLGLGIAGLTQRERKLVFAVLGVAFNGLILASTCVLIAIGMLFG